MLSVNGSRSHDRSKSPGRKDERSRSRDVRAPSPAGRRGVSPAPASRAPPPRAVSPPRTRSSKKYDAYSDDDEEDDELVDSRQRDRDARYKNRKDDRYEEGDRRLSKATSRGKTYDDNEEEDRRDKKSSRYADPAQYAYARPNEVSRHSSYARDQDLRAKDRHVPGGFDDDDDDDSDDEVDHLAYGERPVKQKQRALSSPAVDQYGRPVALDRFGQPIPQQVALDRYGQPLPPQGGPFSPISQHPHGYPPVVGHVSQVGDYARHPQAAGHAPQGGDHAKYPPAAGHAPTALYNAAGGSYEQPAPYQYADLPRDIKYISKSGNPQYTRTPSGTVPVYTRNPSAEIEVESKRHRRGESYDERKVEKRDERREKEGRRDVREKDRRDDKHKKDYREDKQDKRRDDGRSRGNHDSDDSEDSDRHDERRRGIKYEQRRESDVKPARPQVVEIHPGARGGAVAPPSSGLSGRTHRMSLSTLQPGALTLMAPTAGGGHSRRNSVSALPPGSPLLERYHGTYQSISPMPSPLRLAQHGYDDSDLSDLDIDNHHKSTRDPHHSVHHSDSDSEFDGGAALRGAPKSILKRHRDLANHTPYDPENDALALAADFKKTPSPGLLVKVLPSLSNDSILALRAEYKKHMKVNGKGVNIAKHIKLKFPTQNIGKVAYACALGRWESEAHWANAYYQSGHSRRELLIESLFGRNNAEIKAIREAFNDKKYNDSLEKCMQMELKKDKFRIAVLKALEAKRMDDAEPINERLVAKDVDDLRRALLEKTGGETAMIEIIVMRGDDHLRGVLQEYERLYRGNFAREMIGKSQNLVVRKQRPLIRQIVTDCIRIGRNLSAHPQWRPQPACS